MNSDFQRVIGDSIRVGIGKVKSNGRHAMDLDELSSSKDDVYFFFFWKSAKTMLAEPADTYPTIRNKSEYVQSLVAYMHA